MQQPMGSPISQPLSEPLNPVNVVLQHLWPILLAQFVAGFEDLPDKKSYKDIIITCLPLDVSTRFLSVTHLKCSLQISLLCLGIVESRLRAQQC